MHAIGAFHIPSRDRSEHDMPNNVQQGYQPLGMMPVCYAYPLSYIALRVLDVDLRGSEK
jgi:hypothetical protein